MSLKSTSLRAMGLLVALTVASAAQAGTKYYSVNGGGGQAQIGDGLPIPAQDQYSSMGGKNFTNGPIGTFTNFPPLLIPVDPKFARDELVRGTNTMNVQPQITVPPGVFRRIRRDDGIARRWRLADHAVWIFGVVGHGPRLYQPEAGRNAYRETMTCSNVPQWLGSSGRRRLPSRRGCRR